MVCFLPERLLIAAFLVVMMMLFVNRLSSSQACVPNKIRTDIEKNPVAVKLRLNKKVEQCIQEEKRGEKKPIAAENLNEKPAGPNRFMSLVEKDARTNIAYKEAKLRWRNEINDQAFEKRIQTIFEQIRDANSVDYEKGIQEIHHLLDLRRNSLINQSPDEGHS